MLRLGRYQEAHLLSERSMSISGNAFWPAIHLAVANLALGHEKAASDALAELLRRKPGLTRRTLKVILRPFAAEDFRAWYLDCLCRAGLPE